MTISADCLEQMRLMTEAAQSASKGAHRVADQMERINDFLDGAAGNTRKWSARIMWLVMGAAAVAGGGGPLAKFILDLLHN